MTFAALFVLAAVLPLLAFDIARRPLIRRMGLRNLARRPGEAALVVFGSMLGTALIVASFLVGDSFGASFRERTATELGPIDVLLTTDDAERDVEALRAAAPATGHSIDGLLAVRRADVVVANSDGKFEPNVTFWEADPKALREFDSTTGSTEGPTTTDVPDRLDADEVIINRVLASELRLGIGDRLGVLVNNDQPVIMEIVAITPARGLTSFAPVITAPCAISCTSAEIASSFQDVVVISNIGDSYEGALRSDQTEAFLTETLGTTTPPFPAKTVLLRRADDVAAGVTTQFATVSGFSVAAGVLLLINLFVMLAVERRVEMGTMRAVGLQRGTAARAFTLECAVYSFLAIGLGLVVGIGLAAGVIAYASDSFGVDREFEITLAVEASSLFSGAVIGLAISLLAGIMTSRRMTKLNIVAALKDSIAEPAKNSDRTRLVIGGLSMALALGALAVARTTQLVALVAPILLAVATIPVLSRVIGQRAATALGCGAGLIWSAVILNVADDIYADPAVEMFLIQGLLMVGLAVVLITLIDRHLIAAIQSSLRGSVSGRLGLAQPLAWPFRSALLLGMYALVLFTVTFIAVINAVLATQAPLLAARAGGSYDIVVFSSRINPLTAEQLTERADVATAVTVQPGSVVVIPPDLEGSDVEGSDVGDEVKRWGAAINIDFARNGPPVLVERMATYPDDDQAWEALATSDDLVIVPINYGYELGGPAPVVGVDGVIRNLTVVGMSDGGWLARSEFYLPERLADELLIDRAQYQARHLLTTAPGHDPEQLAERLERDFSTNGTDARTFIGQIESQTAERQAFVEMLQAFLGLGLMIGIAGLCVVLVRGVRERRQQLGMLRAIGFGPSTLRNSFLVEAAFVGFRGLLLGISLGLLMARQVVTQSSAFDLAPGFVVPYRFLVILAVVAMAASVVAGLIPAVKAGRTVPAEALRLAT